MYYYQPDFTDEEAIAEYKELYDLLSYYCLGENKMKI